MTHGARHSQIAAGVLAQAEGPEAPLHTFTRLNAERGAGPYQRREIPTGLVVSILGVALVMLLLAWWINRVAKRRPPAAERAFERLSRRLGLGRAGRALVREIARSTGRDPLSLLVSPGAMAQALEHPDRSAWHNRPGWTRVKELAG